MVANFLPRCPPVTGMSGKGLIAGILLLSIPRSFISSPSPISEEAGAINCKSVCGRAYCFSLFFLGGIVLDCNIKRKKIALVRPHLTGTATHSR